MILRSGNAAPIRVDPWTKNEKALARSELHHYKKDKVRGNALDLIPI
ncbi:MAG: hypothetical protein ACRC6V_12355 [Bacteroidales bacterium]